MNKKYKVKQNGYKDCGASCLLSIMKYYGCDASLDEVSYVLKTCFEGTNAYNILQGCRYYGFDGYGIKYTYDDIISGNISFPIICHVLKDNMYHFIVIYNVKKKYMEVMDPSSDICKISYSYFKDIYLGTSLVISPIKRFDSVNDRESLISFMFSYLKLYKDKCIKVILLSFLLIVFSVFINYFVMYVFDYILPNYNYYLLICFTFVFFVSSIVKNIVSYVRGRYLIYVTNNIFIKFFNDFVFRLFNLPYQFFKNKSAGEVISRFNDLKAFRSVFSELMVNITLDIVLIVFSMFILLLINGYLFLIYLFQIFLYFLIVLFFRKCFITKSENVLVGESESNKVLNENIYSYEVNRNLNMLGYSINKINIKNKIFVDKLMSYEYSMNNQLFLKDFIVDVTYILFIFISCFLMYNGLLTTGEFFLFNSVVYYFTEPFKRLLDLSPNINYIKNIYRRINDILIFKSEGIVFSDKTIEGSIELKNVGYSYNGIDYLFDNISFNIEFGSKFLLCGCSGSGKSTLIKILLKYIKNYKGDVYINGVNIKDLDSSIISNSVTYVSQNGYLLNDTFKNNIICDGLISDSEYEQVIKICNLDVLRSRNKLRNNFMIEEDGFNISGGERQKIILARSLLKDSNFIILDEALSEVGLFEEKEILMRLFDYYNDKTIIYISHKKEIIDLFKNKYCIEGSKV